MSATSQPAATARVVTERPTAAFVLSLIAGLLILAGSSAVMMTRFSVGGSRHYCGGMMVAPTDE